MKTKKTLYYTVHKYLSEDGVTINGAKLVNVYEILGNEPKEFFKVECDVDDKTTKVIQDFLDDNGYRDEDVDSYEFVIL